MPLEALVPPMTREQWRDLPGHTHGVRLLWRLLWPPHMRSWLIGKAPDAGRAWGQEEKGMTEDEMAGWHHWWTWVWVNSGSWWWTGRPGVLRFMGSQRVGHDWVTEMNWTELCAMHFEYITSLNFPHNSVKWRWLFLCYRWRSSSSSETGAQRYTRVSGWDQMWSQPVWYPLTIFPGLSW